MEKLKLVNENDLLKQQITALRRGTEAAHTMVTDLLCCGNCIYGQKGLCEIMVPGLFGGYCKNWRTDGKRNHNRLITTDIVK